MYYALLTKLKKRIKLLKIKKFNKRHYKLYLTKLVFKNLKKLI